MYRIVLVLPLCLIVQDQPPLPGASTPIASNTAAALPALPPNILDHPLDLIPFQARAVLNLRVELDLMRQGDPLAFIQYCHDYYERNIHGYITNFLKREKIDDKLLDSVETLCYFQEKPFSVYMKWLSKASLTGATEVLFVRGQNNNKLLGRPALSFLPIQERAVDAKDVMATTRYTIDEFGMQLGTERTLGNMYKAKKRGKLFLRHVPGLIDKRLTGPTWAFLRRPCDPPEDDGQAELTIFICQRTGMQVGSIIKDEHGDLIAEYFFRDIVINPVFEDDQFTRAVFTRKKK